MAGAFQLVDARTDEIVVPRLRLANTFWTRFRGLQLLPRLAEDEGLLITPCRSLHSHWMRFAIDVALLDRTGNVLAIHHTVRPWRFVIGVPGTHQVLEVAAGERSSRWSLGQRLVVREAVTTA